MWPCGQVFSLPCRPPPGIGGVRPSAWNAHPQQIGYDVPTKTRHFRVLRTFLTRMRVWPRLCWVSERNDFTLFM